MRAQVVVKMAVFGTQIVEAPPGIVRCDITELFGTHSPHGKHGGVRHVCDVCTMHISEGWHCRTGSVVFGLVRQLIGPHQS